MTIFDKLIALRVPEIQNIFLEVIQNIVDDVVIAEIVAAIEANDPERLFKAVGMTPAVLSPLIDAIERTYKDGADTLTGSWPRRIITPTGSTIFRFDMRNTKVENDLKTSSSALVSRITEETRENVRNALQAGMIKGNNPLKTALDIVGRIDPVTKKRVGGIIGLASNQERWVRNAETYLENLDVKYFQLELRDKRFDSIVKRAIDSGKSLSQTDVSKIITRYKTSVLKWRGENISRTETIQALNRGQYMANIQAIDEGVLTLSMIKKEWDNTGDRRVRGSHRFLGEKKAIGLDEPFVSFNGARLMYPGDASLGAPISEIAMCRCMVKYKVDFLSRGE